MAEKTKRKSKTKHININMKKGGFVSRLIGSGTKNRKTDIALLRNLLSNEKAKIIYKLKYQNPKSIYELAKSLGRDFKSVRDDLIILKNFGLIEFQSEKTGKRKSLAPKLATQQLNIIIDI